MLADLDDTIRQLLIDDVPIRNNEIDIKFEQPKREWSARLSKPTINFFLYDVRENYILRQQQLEKTAVNGQGGGHGARANLIKRKRTPYRIDCFYMLTTWAVEPEDEHNLLSACLLTLFRHPQIPDDVLQGGLKGQPYKLVGRVASPDKLVNPAEMWGVMDNEIRPTIPYIITLAMDPWTETATPLVRSITFKTGQTKRPKKRVLAEEEISAELTIVGGTIWDKNSNLPAPNIEVAIKGTGYFDTTDYLGRFTLGAIPSGDYTLIAWSPDGTITSKEITVPLQDGDYDIEIDIHPPESS